MNSPNMDDLDVQDMRRLADGHEAALNDLMDRNAPKLFHYLFRCLQNQEDAEDLTQETFVKVYQCRASFDTTRKFSTWLFAIASNLVKDRYRWRCRHPQVSIDEKNDATGESYHNPGLEVGPCPKDQLQAKERAEAVRSAVASLPEELRQPIILAEYAERSHAEIGGILGCSAKAVETRLYRARQQLRASLCSLFETT